MRPQAPATDRAIDGDRCNSCRGRLLGKLRRASRRWSLLPAGARVALGLSGGNDSLAMALLLGEHNRRLRPPMQLVGLHVRLDSDGVTAPLPEDHHSWCSKLGIEIAECLPRVDPGQDFPVKCFRCAQIRRRTLIEAADSRGCSHLALGHHADDVVETWLMSLFYTGTPEVLPPLRSYFADAVTVIRPLYELRRGEIRRLARLCGLPRPPTPCERDQRTRRGQVCAVLAALGRDQKRVRRNIFWKAVRQFAESEAGRKARKATGP